MRRLRIVSAATVVGLALVSCSTSITGSPHIGELQPPWVTNSLEVGKFEQDPCGVLTAEQASELARFTETTGNSDSNFPICSWQDPARNYVAFSFVRGHGLTDAYSYQNSKSGYFQIAPDISGYPAVFSGPHDGRGSGSCQAIVGVRNDVVMTVLSSLRDFSPYYKDPCALAVKATEAAIVTIKGSS